MIGFDPGRSAEDLAQFAANLEQKTRRLEELQGRMAAVSASASSAGGRVRVTVDSVGVPMAIDLSPGVRSMEPGALSAEILACMRKAQVGLRAEVAAVVHGTVGDDPAGASILAILADRFPDPDPENESDSTQPEFAPPPSGPIASAPPAASSRKPDRSQIVTPDEPDDDDKYFNKKSWLV
ncbi:YbaB/EbfC family nucleoid-associated protein [Nocardia sp. NPDC048505]|uniref:YbaB/EbfC family nucleoid-associated protein n=1 Tax=unclassified Nocardia TaxID=2637762 RepID=UPI0033C9D63E